MALESLIFPDHEPDISRMGGKAYALAKLGRKFAIPAWFVVTPGMSDEDITAALARALPQLGDGPYAVRSSAVDEDGSNSSFAGQLQSFLNVHGDDVHGKIQAVRQSGLTQNVQDYRRHRNMDEAAGYPAVLIQKMVKADAAGVVFTADPVSHDTDQIAIMAVRGLADRLVSGEENGDTYHLSRSNDQSSHQLSGNEAVLTDQQRQKVMALALEVEQHFGCPQDIEWAFENDNLYLLQARPITTLQSADEVIIWDNSNIVESYSGVTSPLTFSFARYAYCEVYKSFSRLMGVSHEEVERHHDVFANMLGLIQGHVYYNLLNWYRALALFPGFTLNKAFMEQMMGVGEALPEHILRRIVPQKITFSDKFRASLRMSGTLVCLSGNAVILPWRVKMFYKHLNDVLADPVPPLVDRSLPELAAYYRLLEQELLARWQTPIVNDFLCMIAFGASRKLMEKWCGPEGLTIHNDFMIGQGDIISAEPAQRIRQMAALARGNDDLVNDLIRGDMNCLDHYPELKGHLNAYLKKFGDRCTQELKLESLTLHEDPVSLLQAIGFTARKEYNPGLSQVVDPEKRLNAILKDSPLKRAVSRFLLRWAKSRIRDRENLRFERTRVFGRVRRVFLEMGRCFVSDRILKDQRDVFFLQVDEILSLINGTSVTGDIQGLVALRQAEAEKFRASIPPPNRFETSGAVASFLKCRTLSGTVVLAEGEERQGLGCCSGIIKGIVRVIHDPRTESLRPGEILVARHTDPGWIALFSNASGIVVERGSLLSHSAIVAREMGIPAIVAIPDVMQWLKTGDVVEMDGASGRVVKVAHA